MNSRETLKRVLKWISPYRLQVTVMIILAAVTVLTTLYAPILIGQGFEARGGKGEVSCGKLRTIVL